MCVIGDKCAGFRAKNVKISGHLLHSPCFLAFNTLVLLYNSVKSEAYLLLHQNG
jgi:hypothetical protein